jgi:hypothetical protein
MRLVIFVVRELNMDVRKCISISILLVAIAFVLSPAPPVLAGPYADDMAKCLVKSTSAEDRTTLVKWMFSVVTLHPDLTSMAAISSQQRDALTKSTGALFQKLMLETCRAEAKQAYANEGPQTFEYAFRVLGEVASRGMFTDPHVSEGMKALASTIDEKKMKELLAPDAVH